MLLVSLITAYTLIYDIIRYCSKKIVFDLQHFSVIKFVLLLVQSGLNMSIIHLFRQSIFTCG